MKSYDVHFEIEARKEQLEHYEGEMSRYEEELYNTCKLIEQVDDGIVDMNDKEYYELCCCADAIRILRDAESDKVYWLEKCIKHLEEVEEMYRYLENEDVEL